MPSGDGRIVINTEINTNDVESGLRQIENRVQDVADRMGTIGDAMTKGVSVPLTATGGAAMKFANDFDVATGRIQAGLGVTGKEAEKLTGVAQKVFVNGWGESLTEVSDTITLVRNNMGELNNADLQKVTEGAYILAERFDADVNESTRAAGQLMKDFGVDSTKAMDMLTWGFQNGLDYTGEFLDTVREYSPQFREMGFTGEQMLNTLKAGFDAGAWSLDKVGDSIKESHLRMSDMSEATKEAYKSLGLNAEEYAGKITKGGKEGNKAFQEIIQKLMGVEDATLRNQLSTDLFGTQYEDLREKVIFSMAGASKSIEGLEGTTQRAGEALQDNFGERLQIAFRQLQEALIPLGNVLLDMAEFILPYLTSAIQTVSQWFQSLSPVGQQVVAVIGLIAAAVGPFLTAFSMMIGPLTTAWQWLSKVRAIFPLIRTAMLALIGPVGIISGIVVALALLIYENWNSISKWTTEKWGQIKNFLSNMWSLTKILFEQSLKFISDFIDKTWKATKTVTENAWNGIKSFFSNTWLGMKNATNNAAENIRSYVSGKWQALKDKTNEIYNSIKTKIQNTWNEAKRIVQNTAEAIRRTAVDKFVALRQGVQEKLYEVKQKIMDIWNQAQDWLEGVDLEWIGRNIISGLIRGLWGMFGSLMDTARGIAKSIASKIQSALDIHSPSRVAIELGSFFTEGLEDGLLARAKQLMKAATQVGETVAIGTRKPLQDARLDISKQKVHSTQTASSATAGVVHKTIQLIMPNVRNESDARGISQKLASLETRSLRVGGVNP